MWRLNGPYMLMDADETLKVVRQGREADTDVLYQDGLPTAAHAPLVFDIICTWQPVSGKELLLLPESFREQNIVKMWQPHYQPTVSTPLVTLGDVIVRDGVAFSVLTAQNWGDYTETMCRAIDVGTLSYPVATLITDADGNIVPPTIYPPAVIAP